MRIVGEIEHPLLKITIFQHENKYTVQVEDGQVTQSYKFREDSSLDSVETVKAMFSKELDTISKTNVQMQSVMGSIAGRITEKNQLPKII